MVQVTLRVLLHGSMEWLHCSMNQMLTKGSQLIKYIKGINGLGIVALWVCLWCNRGRIGETPDNVLCLHSKAYWLGCVGLFH
jgi:hypothetical protein